ncbi:MAG: alcohol dehydrogenase catalytic domain-containing protein [Bdellovibrionales bacterium]|nr:alcohol dehydrogenase catalytic domain-containing protein [Bdellovibrionales bacterium]
MNITAAVVRDPESGFVIEPIAIDDPHEDEILVRVAGVGLCHTDLAFKKSPAISLPAVLGHEASGIVEKIGSAVTKVQLFRPHASPLLRPSMPSCGPKAKADPAYRPRTWLAAVSTCAVQARLETLASFVASESQKLWPRRLCLS